MRVFRDLRVPAALLRDPDRFGGTGDGDCRRGDLVVIDGRVAGLRAAPFSGQPRLVVPALVEVHCHLDKCHSIHRLTDVGGDLAAAIAEQARDKAHWTAEDLRLRATRGLDEAVASGCAIVRSHVDWGPTAEPPLAWEVLDDLARDRRGRVDLQRAALVNLDLIADPARGPDMARHLARDGGVLGSFVLGHAHRADGIRAAFTLADRFGLALDFHVDEGLMEGLDGIDLIARTALETGFQGPVLCGHACGLMNLRGADLESLLDLIARSGIAVAALPTTNLYLQGRGSGTPERRGLTRLRELRAAGVPIAIGSDNVGDAFCPTGAHDPMAALHLASLAAHLDPPLDRWLSTITTDAARALGCDPIWVDGAALADLRLSSAATVPDLIAGRAGPPQPFSLDPEGGSK